MSIVSIIMCIVLICIILSVLMHKLSIDAYKHCIHSDTDSISLIIHYVYCTYMYVYMCLCVHQRRCLRRVGLGSIKSTFVLVLVSVKTHY